MESKSLNIHLRDSAIVPLNFSDFTGSDTKRANFQISNLIAFQSPKIKTKLSADFSITNSIDIETPEYYPLIYTISASATSGDCTGREKDRIFYSNSADLYFGYDSVGKRKSWIPFTVDFGAPSASGIYLISAKLKLTSSDTQSEVPNKPCKIKVGCDSRSSVSPVSWNDLNGRVMGKNFFSGRITETWVVDDEYEIDITTAVREKMSAYFGNSTNSSTNAITWSNGSVLPVLAIDFGSSQGSYRMAYSYEGSATDIPVLELTYRPLYYELDVLDTYISYISSTSNPELNKVFYNDTKLYIGEQRKAVSKQRALIAFPGLRKIPSSATINDATLSLYLEGNKSSTSASLIAYNAIKEWDMYGATWNRRNGSNLWGTAGGYGATDFNTSPIGSVAIPSSATVGFKSIDITSAVQDWVTNPTTNLGMILKMSVENDDGHYYTSSRSLATSQRPKLVVNYEVSGTPYSITLRN